MNWTNFQTHDESPNKAFEALCNQLFNIWCKEVSEENYISFRVINGSGGDGGVEAYAVKESGKIAAVQAKWFPNSIQDSQINQIKNSITTALKVRPNIDEYIVCVPRDLASIKMVKGGKISQKTEQNRWDKLQEDTQCAYEGLKVVLWNESYLLELLQRESARGVKRYWFHNSELSLAIIKGSFTKQQQGWLHNRYTPNLHKSGKLKTSSMKFLGNAVERMETYEYTQKNMMHLEGLIDACVSYAKLVKSQDDNDEIMQMLSNTERAASELHIKLDEIGSSVYFEDSFSAMDYNLLSKLDLYELEIQLQNRKLLRETYFHIEDILKMIKAHNEYYSVYELKSQIENQFIRTTQVVIGDPGTGKTHGIVGLAEELYNYNTHIPVFIRAKDFSPNMTWFEIIKTVLGLSSQWSEEELWQAFEALSISRQNAMTTDAAALVIVPKIVICLDGLDESQPYDKWIERLREFDDITRRYPRIKLITTSRDYVFNHIQYGDKLLKGSIRLNANGDVPADKLFDDYIKYYEIDVSNVPWLKWALKTPLALKLFCDLNRGRKVIEMQRASVTITSLLQSKLGVMEVEFAQCIKSGSVKNEHIIHRVLKDYVNLFISNNEVAREDLLEQFSKTVGNDSYKICKELVEYLECEGFLQSYNIHPTSIFEVPKTIYSIGIQPYFDYLAAIYFLENSSLCKINDLSYASHQMLAIMLLEDKGILFSNSECTKDLSGDRLYELNLFALANVSKEKATDYRPFLLTEMKKNSESLINILNKVILKVSRIENHPLGASFLHEFLSEFDTVAGRDQFWSIPAYLTDQEDNTWYLQSELKIGKDYWTLECSDTYDGLPLVYAWVLTTSNNGVRKDCRKQLFNWGKACPEEFIKLLDYIYEVDDVQMKEDLMAVAMSVVMCLNDAPNVVASFSNWTYLNIFEGNKIVDNLSCAIRYYGRAIIERAFALGKVSEEILNASRPPYRLGNNLSINIDALKGTRMGGYGPIDYDLARYVLVDPIESRFFKETCYIYHEDEIYNHYTKEDIDVILNTEDEIEEDCLLQLDEIKSEIDQPYNSWYSSREEIANDSPGNLLNEYANTYSLQSLTSTQFILCAVYEKLLALGWNKEVFYGKPNGGKAGEILGLDIAILREHTKATHGSMSDIMQFAEKYTWIARNELYGFLADRLNYAASDEALSLLGDYGLIDDFPNPAQEFVQLDPDEIQEGNERIFVEDIPVDVKHENELESLKSWITEDLTPNYEKWLYPNELNGLIEKERLTLYGFHAEGNNLNGETLIWINSGLIKSEDLPILVNDARNKKSKLVNLLREPVNYHSSTETDCYITPTEITWFPWKNQLSLVDNVNTVYKGSFKEYEIFKSVEECVANYQEYGDVTYRLPSAKTREILGITYGDGYCYTDKNDEILCYSISTGERWKDSQSFLFADRNSLMKHLDDQGYTMFWTVRIMKQETTKSRELHKNFYLRNDKTMYIYHDGYTFNSTVIYEKVD